jgi:glucose-6-phosphate 1-dehydrogenase
LLVVETALPATASLLTKILPSSSKEAPEVLDSNNMTREENVDRLTAPGDLVSVIETPDDYNKNSSLALVVLGASGDLAKKLTFPSLLSLYANKLFPSQTRIWGYARSNLTSEDLRAKLKPNLMKRGIEEKIVDDFLAHCFYSSGESYSDVEGYSKLRGEIEEYEAATGMKECNRVFYCATPPDVFADVATTIKATCEQDPSKGYTRLIMEKPFGHDLESYQELSKALSQQFDENALYRIDHYLGKEMVQNLCVLRFSNNWFEQIWNAQHVQCVIITMKENFGTEG